MAATHYVAFVDTPEAFSSVPLPIGKSLPFAWPAFAVRRGTQVVLTWRATPGQPERFRLTFALAEREHKIIEMTSVSNGQVLGMIEVHSPSHLQTVEVFLEQNNLALERGIALRIVRGQDPSWFLGIPHGRKAPPALLPPLLPHALEEDDFAVTDALAEFYPRLQSMATIQPFGWKAGAVFDGLWALSRLPGGGKARAMLNAQMGLFVTPGGHLQYLGPANRVVDNEPHSLEVLYPLSILAQIDPHHRAVNAALYWLGRGFPEEDLYLRDALYVTPFAAAVAVGRGVDGAGAEWADWAFGQLEYRHSQLVREDGIWSRRQLDGNLSGSNRMRSVAAYTLAIARTLECLSEHPQGAFWIAEFAQLVSTLQSSQRTDGLWGPSYAWGEEVDAEPELAASALLAYAIALGVRHDWLPNDAKFVASRVASGLRHRLTPDGFLVTPSSEVPPAPPSVIPPGGFPLAAFEDGTFEMPVAPAPYPTGEVAPWAMGWLGAALAALA